MARKLFMFYIGGACGGSNIELHDIRFSTGETPEDCHDDLRRQWWGAPKSLHIDSWAEIGHADGYDIDLRPEPSREPDRLFFLNLGGYRAGEFEEQHRNLLIVAATQQEAVRRGLGAARQEWRGSHKDSAFEVETVVAVSDLFTQAGLHIHLRRAAAVAPFAFTSRYIRLNA